MNLTSPKNWKTATLDQVIDLIGGGTPKTSVDQYWNGDIPWLSVVDFNNDSRWVSDAEKKITEDGLKNSSTKLLEKGDIIISARGTVGALAQLTKPMTFNQSCYGIRAKKNIDQDFIFYLLKYSIPSLVKNVHGAVFDTLTRESFSHVEAKIPESLDDQREIAAILGSLDDKIELLRRENKTLESIAQALFREWFVKPGSSEITELEEIIDFDPKVKVSKSEKYLFYDMKSLSDNSMSMDDGIYRAVSSGSIFQSNDTLLAKITPCLENGKTGFVFDINGEVIARGSTEFVVMRAKKDISQYFVYCLARSEDFRDHAIKSMSGTSGRQRVQISQIKKYQINTNQGTMNKFHVVSQPTFNKINNNQKEIKTLSRSRDQLLDKIFSN